MMSTAEKVAYLKGLIDGTEFDSKEQKKMFIALTDVLRSLANDVAENSSNIDNVDAHLLEVDEDLGAVESIVYGSESEKDDDNDDDLDYDSSFGFDEENDLDDYFDDSEDVDDSDDFSEDDFDGEDVSDEENDVDSEEMYEIECPACHETIYLQESVILEGGVDCPNCGEPLEFDIEFEDED